MSLGPLMVDLPGTTITDEDREVMRHPLVGGVILFARNFVDPTQLTELVAGIHAVRSPPLIVAVDQEGGRVQRFQQGFSRLPPARLIGHAFDQDPKAGIELARRVGWLMAAELRAHGVDISFAPVVDLDYGVNEAIGTRAFHKRSDVVGQLAVAYVTREHGVVAGLPVLARLTGIASASATFTAYVEDGETVEPGVAQAVPGASSTEPGTTPAQNGATSSQDVAPIQTGP